MKKIYILAISILGFQSMNAQITLTASNNNPSVGNSFTQNFYDANTTNPGISGANVTWNFSSLTPQSTSAGTMVAPSTLSDGSNHPASNIATEDASSGNQTFMFVDGDELSMTGGYSPGAFRDVYTNIRELVKFPITFGNSFNETFSGTSNNIAANQTFDRSGTIAITADGYGDLVLPYGTITNVLRVKTVTLYSDAQGGVPFINYQDTSYYWYNTSTNYIIMSWTVLNTVNFSSIKVGMYLDQSSVVTSLGDDFIPNKPITIYPNPVVNNQTNILLDKLYENAQLQVIDVTGKIVKTDKIEATSKNLMLKLDGLNKGIYFIQILKDNTLVSSEKLILN